MSEIKKPTNLHIFLFFIGFVILFTLVFVLGVVVGKGLSTRGEVEVAEVTKQETTESLQDSEPQNEETLNNNNVDSEENNKDLNEVAQEEQSDEKVAEPERDTSPKEAEVVKDKPVKKEEVAKVDKKPEKENQLGYEKKPEQPKPVGDVFPSTDPGGKFTVQVGSFKDKSGAEKVLASYKSKGYPAILNTVTTDQNETFYRVSIGTFSKRDTAKKYFEVLKNKEKDISGFITVRQ